MRRYPHHRRYTSEVQGPPVPGEQIIATPKAVTNWAAPAVPKEHTLPCPDCKQAVTGPVGQTLTCPGCGIALEMHYETPQLPPLKILSMNTLEDFDPPKDPTSST